MNEEIKQNVDEIIKQERYPYGPGIQETEGGKYKVTVCRSECRAVITVDSLEEAKATQAELKTNSAYFLRVVEKTLEEEDQRKHEKTVDYLSGFLPEVFKTLEAPLQTLDKLVKEYNSEELLQACKRFEENYEFSGYTSAVLEEFRDVLKFPKGGVKYHYEADSGKSLVSVVHPNGYLWVFEVKDLCGDEEWKFYYEVSPEGVEYSHEEDKCRLTLFISSNEDFAWKGTSMEGFCGYFTVEYNNHYYFIHKKQGFVDRGVLRS